MTEFKSANQLKRVDEGDWELKTRNANIEDENSKLGTYLIVAPLLVTPVELSNVVETERITITCFRVGSHNLRIETGRCANVPRDQRVCLCETGVQTIKHFFLECPLLTYLRDQSNTSVLECLQSQNIMNYIMRGAKIFEIEL